MLVAIQVPLTAADDHELPADVGRANYAEVLNQFNRIDRTLANLVHEGDGAKPLTCSSLIGPRTNGRSLFVRRGETYSVRLTGLTPEVSQGLLTAFRDTPPAVWRVHGCSFDVTKAVCDAALDPWTGQTTYGELAAQPLLDEEQNDRLNFVFDSPTAFKSAGRHFPLPLPELVFGSLAERWNAFSPVVLSPEMRTFGHEFIGISDFNLRSHHLSTKNEGMVIGGAGRVTYRLFTANRNWLAQVHMLANFAVYSGVGVKTTFGMGRLRRLTEREWRGSGRRERG